MIYKFKKFNEEIGDNDPHWNELDSGTGYELRVEDLHDLIRVSSSWGDLDDDELNENILEYLEQVLGDRKI